MAPFCFAELHTADMELGKGFYSAVLGWEAVDSPTVGEYAYFRLNQDRLEAGTTYDVAGLRRTEGPHRWVAYVSVESVDHTTERAHQLGAVVVTAPCDTPGLARTCVLADLEGTEFGLWEARSRHGADVQDQTGSTLWIELMARDVAAARRFYTSLFGWAIVDTLKYGPPYTIFKGGDISVGGAMQFGPDWGVRPHWQVYFAVDDPCSDVPDGPWRKNPPHQARTGVVSGCR